jgi:HSP20 family molecular chaperone IbpA
MLKKGFEDILLNFNKPDVKMISNGLQNFDGYKIPTHEIHEEKDKVVVTLEMPGIGKENIRIEQDKKNITIIAEKEELKYRKAIKLNFDPKSNEITANNGIISIEFKK